jgi:hypothetical protein
MMHMVKERPIRAILFESPRSWPGGQRRSCGGTKRVVGPTRAEPVSSPRDRRSAGRGTCDDLGLDRARPMETRRAVGTRNGLYPDRDLWANEPLRALTVAGFAPLVAGRVNPERLEALFEILNGVRRPSGTALAPTDAEHQPRGSGVSPP